MKKGKIAITATIILGVIFIFTLFLERHLEGIIREKMSTLPFKVTEIDFDIFSQRLTLHDFQFEYFFKNKANDAFSISIEKAVIEGLNTSIETIQDGMPKVFKKMQLDNLLLVLKTANKNLASMRVEKYTILEYAHNVHKILEEYKKQPFSESFFTALLSFQHGGIEKIDTFFVFNNEKDETSLYTKKAVLYPMENIDDFSVSYEGVVWNNTYATIESNMLKIDNMRIANAEALSNIALEIQKNIATSTFSIWQSGFEKNLFEKRLPPSKILN